MIVEILLNGMGTLGIISVFPIIHLQSQDTHKYVCIQYFKLHGMLGIYVSFTCKKYRAVTVINPSIVRYDNTIKYIHGYVSEAPKRQRWNIQFLTLLEILVSVIWS